MGTVEKSIVVDRPISTVYNQWTQFEDFPAFMEGVESVTQLDDRRLQWRASMAGVEREWEAEIVDQIPDDRISWVSTSGFQNNGTVTFLPAAPTDAGHDDLSHGDEHRMSPGTTGTVSAAEAGTLPTETMPRDAGTSPTPSDDLMPGTDTYDTVGTMPTDRVATRVTLRLEFEEEGIAEKVADALGIVDRRVEGDLERFKEFIEERAHETGGWRGQV